eukprot:10269750-Lingulodinium_polyedra.AAC.1
MRDFYQSAQQSVWDFYWRRAASHHLGSGLEGGAYVGHAIAYIKRLSRGGRAQDAGLAKAVLTGA